MKSYPVEYRRRVIALAEDGYETSEIAESLGTSGAWVRSINALHRSGQPLEPKSRANKRKSLAEREGPHPGASPSQTRHHPRRPQTRFETRGFDLRPLVRPARIEDRPKKKSLHAAEQSRPDVVAARAQWKIAAPRIDPARLVFLDETFGHTAMTRLYGWGPLGERVHYPAPHGHWKTTTFVAAFRLDGLFAPMVVVGALNGALFAKYIRQELAPHLRSGDILVLDNLPTHKVKGVAEAYPSGGDADAP